ncbi:hypothetical protein [Serratia proteamaculans]|uniref:hypothetical protein n=1 Tax=Serratia proteamaculans TaxID=28151 RepID=UPI003D06E956
MKKIILLSYCLLSFGVSSAISTEEYISKSHEYIKSCNTLKVLLEDKASKGERYQKIIFDDLNFRIGYYHHKYGEGEYNMAAFEIAASQVISTCLLDRNAYLNIDKAVSNVYRKK